MLIRKAWIKVEKCNVNKWHTKLEKWRGLFLFGFIPVYLWVVEYEYSI